MLAARPRIGNPGSPLGDLADHRLDLLGPVQLDAHRDQRALEIGQHVGSVPHAPWTDPMIKAERCQAPSRLADVPFHRVEPVAAIGDMGDAEAFACCQKVVHSLREQGA